MDNRYYGSRNELYHHGVKGQRWGVRRYQNEDGTLTRAGRERYNAKDYDSMEESKKIQYNKDRFRQTRNDYARAASNGKKFAKFCLLGPIGTLSYNTLRAQGDTRFTAGAKTFVSNLLLPTLGPVILDQVTRTNYAKNKVKTTS